MFFFKLNFTREMKSYSSHIETSVFKNNYERKLPKLVSLSNASDSPNKNPVF